MASIMAALLACLLSLPSTASAGVPPIATSLECGYRKLMYAKVVTALSKGTPGSRLEAFESLELGTMCGEAPPSPGRVHRSTASTAALSDADRSRSVFVAASGEHVGAGEAPTVNAALAALRQSGGVRQRRHSFLCHCLTWFSALWRPTWMPRGMLYLVPILVGLVLAIRCLPNFKCASSGKADDRAPGRCPFPEHDADAGRG